MKTAILIPCWNGSSYISCCLESILSLQVRPTLVLVVDDGSTDNSLKIVNVYGEKARQAGIRVDIVQNSRNLGFTRTVNIGLRKIMSDSAGYDLVILLNQDTTVHPEWLTQLQAVFELRKDVGAAGSKIFYPDKVTLQHAGGYLIRPRMVGLHYGHHQQDHPQFNVLQETDFVTGAAMALRVDCLRQAGLFDEVYSPGYYEDVDLCIRLHEMGWHIVYCPQAIATHIESASFNDWPTRLTLSHRNRIIFALHWMDTPSFRAAFDNDERAFLCNEASRDDLYALAIAYGRVLLMWQSALQTRLSQSFQNTDGQIEVIHLLAGLREEALHSIKFRQ